MIAKLATWVFVATAGLAAVAFIKPNLAPARSGYLSSTYGVLDSGAWSSERKDPVHRDAKEQATRFGGDDWKSSVVGYFSSTFGVSKPDEPKYVLASVDRGDIIKTVTASGALSAITTVQVSSQVSGEIKRILADYNAEVKQGDVIAEIDPLSFEIAVEQTQGELKVAEAAVMIQKSLYEKATADLASARSVVESSTFQTEKERIAVAEAKRDVERKQGLSRTGSVSQVDYLKAQATLETAIQTLKSAEADERTKFSLAKATESTLSSVKSQVVHAMAVVQQRRATLKAAQTQLERTKIRSRINGVVIGRTIEEGQQVTVTLQTQTLFTVAQDLSEMQIKISVDEADVGKIREGQTVMYTVDSFPGREFRAEVKQIRMDPQEKQNVVTYIVIASAPNPDRTLMPGMTANARIITELRENVQKVPVAALRFAPADETIAKQPRVWILDADQRLREVPVVVGLSDGKMVAVTSKEPLDRVVIGVDQSAAPPTLAKRMLGTI
jgi:HlyD family secretion protein